MPTVIPIPQSTSKDAIPTSTVYGVVVVNYDGSRIGSAPSSTTKSSSTDPKDSEKK